MRYSGILLWALLTGVATAQPNFIVKFKPATTGINATSHIAEWEPVNGGGWNQIVLSNITTNGDGSLSAPIELNLQQPINLRVRSANDYGLSEPSNTVQLGKPSAPILLGVTPTE